MIDAIKLIKLLDGFGHLTCNVILMAIFQKIYPLQFCVLLMEMDVHA